MRRACPSRSTIQPTVMNPGIRFKVQAMRWLYLFLVLSSYTEAFYVPGWTIKTWKPSAEIPLLVNKIYSDNTELQYAYYSLPFVCPPSGTRHGSLLSGESISLNLGEVLRGDRITQSDIELLMGQHTECQHLCTRKVNRADLQRAKELVKAGYVAEWIVDNLPGATSFVTVDKKRKYYAAGFKLGFTEHTQNFGDNEKVFIYNHLTIVLRVRKAPGRKGERGEKVIVGFEVYTKSVAHGGRIHGDCPKNVTAVETPLELYIKSNKTDDSVQYPAGSDIRLNGDDFNDDGALLDIPYTYSVYFREDEKTEWAHRWDPYFVNQEEESRIHWLAIINSLIILGLLSGIVAMILTKTIREDIMGYQDGTGEAGKSKKNRFSCRSRQGSRGRTLKIEESGLGLLDPENPQERSVVLDDEALEDATGWKLLLADVFRPPQYGHILAPLVGSGMQLLFMFTGLVILSAVGILNPSFRGGFISVGIGLFIFAGLISGYFSNRLYKTFHGTNTKRNTLLTATLFPALLFTAVFILNLFVWAQASSTALPFSTLLIILCLWLFIQLPLVHMGTYFGNLHGIYETPVKTHSPSHVPPRPIPPQPWYIRPPLSMLLSGLIPFTIIFFELLFIFQSLWSDKSSHYYLFGFLSIISVLLLLVIAEVAIVSTYIRLCNDDWAGWWWGCFSGGASIALWVWVYCGWFFVWKMKVQAWSVSAVLYFVYTGLGCVLLGTGMGTVGFLVGFGFLRSVFGAIKID